MGLLVDRAFIDAATNVPTLRERVRDAIVEAMFTRDDRVLPKDIIAVLSRAPAVTVKVKSDTDVQKLVRVANGQESTISLGLPAEDYHYVRRQLSVTKDRDIGVYMRPTVLTSHGWIVPPQGGIEVDVTDMSSIQVDEKGHRAIAGVGARWKALYDEAARAGRAVPFYPLVPLHYALGDALYGDAVFQSYRGSFRRYLYAVRSFASHGGRARIGFEEVPNNGTGYDLLGLMQNSLSEFVVPIALAVGLAAPGRVTRNWSYLFPDVAKLAVALGKLTASGRALQYANVYDAAGWSLVHPGTPGAPLVLELGISGAPSVVAAREKALDTVLAGFTTKSSGTPSPYDASAREYARTSDRIAQLLIPGYVTVPVKSFPDLVSRFQQVSDAARAKLSLIGAVRQRGSVSLAPAFEAPKEPRKVYTVSRSIWEAVQTIPGASYLSRLAQLWSQERMYRARLVLLQRLKAEIDSARIVDPTVSA